MKPVRSLRSALVKLSKKNISEKSEMISELTQLCYAKAARYRRQKPSQPDATHIRRAAAKLNLYLEYPAQCKCHEDSFLNLNTSDLKLQTASDSLNDTTESDGGSASSVGVGASLSPIFSPLDASLGSVQECQLEVSEEAYIDKQFRYNSDHDATAILIRALLKHGHENLIGALKAEIEAQKEVLETQYHHELSKASHSRNSVQSQAFTQAAFLNEFLELDTHVISEAFSEVWDLDESDWKENSWESDHHDIQMTPLYVKLLQDISVNMLRSNSILDFVIHKVEFQELLDDQLESYEGTKKLLFH